jgi:hypothetical protein
MEEMVGYIDVSKYIDKEQTNELQTKVAEVKEQVLR